MERNGPPQEGREGPGRYYFVSLATVRFGATAKPSRAFNPVCALCSMYVSLFSAQWSCELGPETGSGYLCLESENMKGQHVDDAVIRSSN